MLRLLVAALVMFATLAPSARASCPAPSVTGTAFASDFDTSRAESLTFGLAYADRLRVDWGDGTTTDVAASRIASLRHRYTRPGRYVVAATASAPCGQLNGPTTRISSLVAKRTVQVLRPCARRRTGVGRARCDRERGWVVLSDGHRSVRATWITVPCRDSFEVESVEPGPPIARAASCAASADPSPVHGAVRAPGRVVVRLGAPADRLSVAVGDPRGPRHRAVRGHAIDRSDRVWVVRIPMGQRGTRLHVRVLRRGAVDRSVAGLSAGR